MGYYDDERIQDPNNRGKLMSLGQSLAHGKRKFKKEQAVALAQHNKGIQGMADQATMQRQQMTNQGNTLRTQMTLDANAGLRSAQTGQANAATAVSKFGLKTDRMALPTKLRQLKLEDEKTALKSKLLPELMSGNTGVPLDTIKEAQYDTGLKLRPLPTTPPMLPIKEQVNKQQANTTPNTTANIHNLEVMSPQGKLKKQRNLHVQEGKMGDNDFHEYLNTLPKREKAAAVRRRRRSSGAVGFKSLMDFINIGKSKDPRDIAAVRGAEKPIRDAWAKLVAPY